MSGSSDKKYVSKRVKVKTVPFEPDVPVSPNKRKSAGGAEVKDLLYHRNAFLAVRNDEDGFYICRTLQHIYEKTQHFSILWLEQDEEEPDAYDVAYNDHLDADCILTDIRVKRVEKDRYHLPQNQKQKVERALSKSVQGYVKSEEDESEEESDEEPVKKKRKIDAAPKKGSMQKQKSLDSSAKGKLKKTNSAVAAAKVIKKRALGNTVAKGRKTGKESENAKAKVTKMGRKKGVLVPRGSIKVLEKDPFLNSKEKVPFISTLAQSKLVLRAAVQNDVKLLKELIEDRDHVARLDLMHSHGFDDTALQIAMRNENLAFAQLLCKQLFIKDKDLKKQPKRVALTTSLLQSESTGRYNRTSLHGVQFVRKLNMSRGSREGNNAFTKDFDLLGVENWRDALTCAMEKGVSKAALDKFCAMMELPSVAKEHCYSIISVAVQMGHRKLAAALMDDLAKTGLPNFNFLHHDVLAFDNQDLKGGIRDISVKKRSFNNDKITPLHCAAVNPNRKYLSKLLSILPDSNIMDSARRRLIHYAVACEGTGPLEFLLDNGASVMEVDNNGWTPLFMACLADRPHNVELLLARVLDEEHKKSKAKADDDSAAPNNTNKFGICGINMPCSKPSAKWFSYTPLHLSAHYGYNEIAEILINYGARVDSELNASKNKLTPLMIAASAGHIETVRLLIKHGAKVTQKDKLKRTPMMLAAMNGQAHIISFLLSLGCSADDQDTSGNTALHYAAGYGWYFCVKILLDSKANPNVSNDWKTTPLGIAFLKGHVGLADILLEQPCVDINFRLDGGLTLVHTACTSALIEGIVEQLEYLVIKKKADCSLADDNGCNALHHLAKNDIKLEFVHNANLPCKLAMARSVKMAEMLIKHGCDVSAKDNDERTPLMCAVEQGNQQLVEFLVKNGAGVSAGVDKTNRNILHFLSEQCMTQSMAEILTMLQRTTADKEIMAEMARKCDSSGMTPLIRACFQYRFWKGELGGNQVSDADIESYTFDPADEKTPGNKKVAKDNSDDEDEDADEDAAAEENKASDEDGDDEKPENSDDEENEENNMEAQEDGDEEGSGQQNKTSEKSMTVAERQAAQWAAGRSYICKLVEICRTAADIPLQARVFPKFEVIPEKEEERYIHKSLARLSAVHFLVGVKHEMPVTETEGDVTRSNSCPALSEFLKCLSKKSDAEMYSLFGRTPLLQAIAVKHQSAAQNLIEFGVNVNEKSTDKETDGFASPLVFAAKNKLHELIPLMLKNGANTNEKDSNTLCTALHYVIQNPVSQNFRETVESLLSYKASATEVDKQQKTALHLLMEHARDTTDAVTVAGLLLKAGAAIDACDRKGRTPLHLAVNFNSGDANCSVEMEQFLLDRGANQFARDWLQRLPLHYVFVKIGSHTNTSAIDPMELCSTLTSSTNKPGSMVNYGDQFGLTPLHVAARRGAAVCCIHLIKKGSNVNSRDFDGNTALSLAVMNKHESCTILLLQNNGDMSGDIVIVPPPPSSKEEAVDTGDESLAKKKKKEKPAWKWSHLKPAEKTPETKKFSIFQGAVANEWQGVIFLMLDLLDKFSISLINVVHAALVTRKYHLALSLIRKVKEKRELTVKLENNQNLAHILAKASAAAEEDHMITVVAQLLYDRGISFDLDDEYGCTPMHYACLNGNKPLVNFILGCYKNINLGKKDKFGRTAMAATFWKLNQNQKIAAVIATILHGRGASLDVLCSYPCQQVYMFGHKRDIEPGNYIRSLATNPLISPLMLAIMNHDFQLVHDLIKLGANINFQDVDGRTPLMVAVYENNIHLVRLLLDCDYVIPTGNEEEEVSTEAVKKQAKGKSSKVFALGRKLQKLPSITKQYVKDQITGKASQITIVNGLNMSTKMYPKKSAVNPTALDNHSRSALHYLVRPLPEGSYDNYRLLQQLVSVGTPLEQADKDGKTVLDYALAHGLPRLTTAVQYLLNNGKAALMTPNCKAAPVSDGITWNNPAPNYVLDSCEFIDKFEKNVASEEGLTDAEFKAVPDAHLSEATTGQVLIDNDLDVPYDILMTKIDVAVGCWGLYNFYKMQIIHQKGKDLYVLFTRWGRIGDSGQFQQTPFPKQADAVKEFCKIFRSKSGNEWKQVKSFDPKPRKYRLVLWEQRNYGRKAVDITVDLTSNITSKLHPYVKDMISEITDMAMLASSMDQLGIDRSVVPLGRIKKEILEKAKDVLFELRKLVDGLNKMRENLSRTDMDQYAKEMEKIAKLSNEYYHLLPKRGFEYERIPVLDQNYLLEKEWRTLEELMELEIAAKIIIGAQHSIKLMNPMDYVYRCLNCQIKLMDENETEAQYLLRYVSATWPGKVEAIFRIARKGEEQRLASCGVDNHRLLFHGSSSSNLISILSKGLLIAPPDAPGCGNAFGEGIYTADRFTKSLAYCNNYSQRSEMKFMLVCEVALGKATDCYQYSFQEKVPDGCQSVHGVGQNLPDSQYDLTLPTGAVIPLGDSKFKDRAGDQYICLSDSEYIIYKESQLCLRYIIQFIS